jgi:hypothetical protein
MAKREQANKKQDALDELEAAEAASAPLTKQNVEFSPSKKKKTRRKLRKSKSSLTPTSRSQFTRSYVFDTKRDKDKASVKVSSVARIDGNLLLNRSPSPV